MSTIELTTKGFNAGYLIEKFSPELSSMLQASLRDKDDPFILGFLLGSIEYRKEISLDKPASPSKDRDSPEKGGDDLELKL